MKSKFEGYIKKEVAEILNVKPSLVQYYTDKKLITPEIDAPTGKGTRRRYSKRNILEISVIKRLVDMGTPLDEAAMFVVIYGTPVPPDSIMDALGLPQTLITRYKTYRHTQGKLKDEFWSVDKWRGKHNAFLIIIKYSDGTSESSSLVFCGKEEKLGMPMADSSTRSILALNLTDLVEKLVNI